MMTLTRLDAFKRNLIGHIVCCVTTAKETIEKLSSEKWDYVFLDHDLGGQTYVPSGPGTGYEVAQWISNNPDQKPEKVIGGLPRKPRGLAPRMNWQNNFKNHLWYFYR